MKESEQVPSRVEKPGEENQLDAKAVNRRSFFAFAAFVLAEIGGVWVWFWYRSLPKNINALSEANRNFLHVNQKINARFYSPEHLAPQFPKDKAVKEPRSNGEYGLDEDLDPDTWLLHLVDPIDSKNTTFKIDEFKSFPKHELVFDFKCIEGWDQVVYYAGTRLSDFLVKHRAGVRSGKTADIRNLDNWYKYVGMETPDGEYFVGIDMKSALHPQTLLCYEQNAKDLEEAHGAPLRLIIPLKYGVKNIKRIGKIFFSDAPPRDYWNEDGYDYDLAL